MKHLLEDPTLWREAAFIGGAWLAGTPHGRYAVHNPADGSLLAELPRCREDETRRAIDAAQAAFGPWRRTTAKARGEVLHRWYELIHRHHEDLATLITLERLDGGFYEPTVLADATSAMRIAHEETFGPVLPLFRFETDDEVIATANDTEAGMVGINCGLISNEVAPFGGIKQSGLGGEGSHLGRDEYVEVKYLCWEGLDAA